MSAVLLEVACDFTRVTSVRNSEGSKIVGMRHVTPSQMILKPRGSSRPWTLRVAPPKAHNREPSGCSRTLAVIDWSFNLNEYFRAALLHQEVVFQAFVRNGLGEGRQIFPRELLIIGPSLVKLLLPFRLDELWDLYKTAAKTSRGVFVGTAILGS